MAIAKSIRKRRLVLTPRKGVRDKRYYFALPDLMQASTVATISSGKEFSQVVWEGISAPYLSNDYVFGFPDHYAQQASANAETALNSALTIVGFAVGCCIPPATTWTLVQAKFAGSNSAVVDPSLNLGGVINDAIHFPVDLPANTRLQLRLIYTGAVGAQVPQSNMVKRKLGNVFSVPAIIDHQLPAYGSPTDTFSASLLSQSPNTGSTTGVGCYKPTWAVCRAVNGLDRPVFMGYGDSIFAFTAADRQQFMNIPSGAVPGIAAAIDDSTRSRRMIMSNHGRAGTSPNDWSVRAKVARALNLIRQLPNRPYTHIISEHYTNATGADATAFRTMMTAYYALLKSESMAWGGAAAPIYQARPIPKSSSTDVWKTLANQTQDPLSGGSFVRWPFDADLLAGYYTDVTGLIDQNRDLAHDQATNRDKFKQVAFTAALSADAASGATSIALTQAVAIGDTLSLNDGTTKITRDVTDISNGGLTATLGASLPAAMAAANTVVGKSYSIDAISHLSPLGGAVVREATIDWKIATFG